MNKQSIYALIVTIFVSISAFAQKTGIITGTIRDKSTQTPIAFANLGIENTNIGVSSDSNGVFTFENVPVGSYNVKVSYTGFIATTIYNVIVTSGNAQNVDVELQKNTKYIKDVVIKSNKNKSAVVADLITPLSVQRLTSTEIRSNPGGNFDVSKVVQALPGVAGSTAGGSFRNDIIIRGGAPNENVFYLDGIEIPVLNHFQTQGSSGGPAGILNVSFLEDVKLSSSAFDAKYDNALASVFQFKQRNGSSKKFGGNVRLSGTEVAVTLEGPASKNTTYLASFRRSYLQLLFKAIDLPIRPNYWDFQFKTNTKLNSKTTLTLLGVGAIDEFTTETPKDASPENEYILRSVPYINQWNYTNGASIRRTIKDGYYNVSLSRNMFDNSIDQFSDKRIGDENFRALKIRSQEIENKLRFDYNKIKNGYKYSFGAMTQYVKFNNDLYTKITNEVKDTNGVVLVPRQFINYNTNINFMKFGLFGQISKRFLNEKLGVNFGLRTDMNSFTTDGFNPLNAISPRLSLSYSIAPQWQVSASVGNYAKLPTYTALGYKNASNVFENKSNKYIQCQHYVTGLEFLPKESLRFTAELFYKKYSNYAVSKANGISIANLGNDFSVVGNEALLSNGKGNAYGFELFVQQKLVKNIFATASYTFVRSEFSGASNVLIPSFWDNKHLFSGILGKKFKRNWEMGLKYRFTAGSPYTPYDTAASRISSVVNGAGTLNYAQLNTLRLGNFSQLDFRLDKKINFKRTTLDLYIDVSNALLTANPSIPNFTFKRKADNSDFETTDGKPLAPNGSNGIVVAPAPADAIPTPTIGFIFEF
jgi:hypothetical protein